MWFTAAYDSILGLKWLIMALKLQKRQNEIGFEHENRAGAS